MRTVLVLVGNEFRRFATDKAAISLTFIVPLVLIYIFGNVFGVNSEDRGPKGIPLAVVNETDAPASAAIVSALQKEPAFKVITSHKDANGVERVLTEAEVREMMRADDIRFALIFLADATSDSEMALKMKFMRNARNEIETETVDGLVQKTIFIAAPQALLESLQRLGANQVGSETMARFNHSLADVIARGFGGDPAKILHSIETGEFNIPGTTPTNTNANSFLDRLIKIEREEIGGEHAKSPMATRSVGGYAVMFLLFRSPARPPRSSMKRKPACISDCSPRPCAGPTFFGANTSSGSCSVWCNCSRFSSRAVFCSASISRSTSSI